MLGTPERCQEPILALGHALGSVGHEGDDDAQRAIVRGTERGVEWVVFALPLGFAHELGHA